MATEKEKNYLKELSVRKRKKFELGCDADREEIFDYPYLTDDETIAFIKEHGRIMFIIRGPNSTLKATLSEMIMTHYPSSQHCCADHFFSKTFSPPDRTKETLSLSHKYCEKKVTKACEENKSPIIVQNTHMRKWEVQKYLDIAAVHNYTVIMAITFYKFNVTPEALARINPDGLNATYFRHRLKQFHDIPPLFTGWFLSPNDTICVLKSLQTTLSALLHDGKFCRIFNFFDKDDIQNYYDGRRNLYCIAGFTYREREMRIYYLSDMVQECYGKSYFISILGYLITKSEIMAIVGIDKEMSRLTFKLSNDEGVSINRRMTDSIDNNVKEYKAMIPLFHDSDALEQSVTFEDWEDEDINFKKCMLMHVAQQKSESFDIIHNGCMETLSSLADDLEYTELEDIFISRLPNDEWLVKLPRKMKLKTLFTGLYM